MRNRKELEEAIAEGRGILLDDGRVVTRVEDLDEAMAKPAPEPTSTAKPAEPTQRAFDADRSAKK